MSYIPIDTDIQKLINEKEENISMSDTPKKNINYARHVTPHSESTKNRIATTQKARYNAIRELVRRGQENPMTEDRVKMIVDEAIDRYIRNHAIPIKNNNNQPTDINL